MTRSPTVVRALAAAVLVVAVGGCELFKPNQEATAIIEQRVIGKPVSEFFDRYGRPTSRVEVADSTTVYKWISDFGMTPPGPEGQDERICRLILTVDKAGRIRNVDISYDAQGKHSRSRCGEIFAAP
ncbi:MAG TPA: hypothetical protein VLD35_15615 [Caldimonas sp.]|nr:hypothetical protein [Caldimonas sp.]